MRGHIRNYKLKNGGKLWAAVVYQGKRVSRSGKLLDSYRWIRGFQTQKAAQTELNKVLQTVHDGTYIELSKQTIAEYLERWLSTVQPNLAAKTFERYKELVDININPKLGPIKLSKLQPFQLAEFYTWCGTSGNRRSGKGLSTRTVLHIHRLLRKALQQAVIWQLRPTNPANAVETPRPAEKEMQPIDEERATLLIKSAENSEMYLPILMGLCTGMRRGELLAARWSDLDFENGRLTVNQSIAQTREGGIFFKSPKNKTSRRTIALPDLVLKALTDHQAKQQEVKKLFGADYPDFDLILSLPDGTPWEPDRFTDAYRAFARRVGAREFRFHDLRHTHASELLRRGLPVKTVSRRLGHANATVTMNVYAHLMSGDDEKAAEMVNSVYGRIAAKKGAKHRK